MVQSQDSFQEEMRGAGADLGIESEETQETTDRFSQVFEELSVTIENLLSQFETMVDEFLASMGLEGLFESSDYEPDLDVPGMDYDGDGEVTPQERTRYLRENPEVADDYRARRIEHIGLMQDALAETYETNVALRNNPSAVDDIVRDNDTLEIGESFTDRPRNFEGVPNVKPRVGRNVYTSGVPGRLRNDRDGDGGNDTYSTPERVTPNIIWLRETLDVNSIVSLDHHTEMREGIDIVCREHGICMEHVTGTISSTLDRNYELFANALRLFVQGDVLFHCSWGAHRAVVTYMVCEFLADPNLRSRATEQDFEMANRYGWEVELAVITRENNIDILDDFKIGEGGGREALIDMFNELVRNPEAQSDIRRRAGL